MKDVGETINDNNTFELSQDVTLFWGVEKFGFGQFHFYEKDNKMYIKNECMSKDSIKKILNLMIDAAILEN